MQDVIYLRVVLRYARTAWHLPNLDLQPAADAAELLGNERVITRSHQRKRRPTSNELRRICDRFLDLQRRKLADLRRHWRARPRPRRGVF